jgi:hypothetical protein
MIKARDNGLFTGMVRDKLYIDNNMHTPRREVTEGTHVKEVAVEYQLCTSYRQTGKGQRVSSTPDSYH